MRDVGFHDQVAGELSKDEYLRKTVQFGIPTKYKDFTVPANEVCRILRLTEI